MARPHKSIGLAGVLLIAVATILPPARLSGSTQGDAPVQTESETLVSLDRQRWDACSRKDLAALAASSTDDVVYMQDGSVRHGQKDYLAAVQAESEAVSSYSILGPEVRFIGEVAVVCARMTKVAPDNSKRSIIYSTIFHRRDGVWKLVSFVSTEIRPSKRK